MAILWSSPQSFICGAEAVAVPVAAIARMIPVGQKADQWLQAKQQKASQRINLPLRTAKRNAQILP